MRLSWLRTSGQNSDHCIILIVLLLLTGHAYSRPDFLDSMSRQFFGVQNNDGHHQGHEFQPPPGPFAQMFGAPSQPIPSRPPPPPNSQDRHTQRQGYYAPHPPKQHSHHLVVSGQTPVYGQQHGFGQRRPDSNDTKTDGYPNEGHEHYHQPRQSYAPQGYVVDHHQAVEYQPLPETSIVYQKPPVEYHQVAPEYHHLNPAIEEQEHHKLQAHRDTHNHEYIEYNQAPPIEYHHPSEKPKQFQISFKQNPDYKIIDHHLKLPPVKFRFHINPKIVITSNTKDPLDKKHHDDEYDLEPYPPPDAFSDHNAPPSFTKQIVEHYPVHHHYPEAHHVVKHYPVDHIGAKSYPVDHIEAKSFHVDPHAIAHVAPQEYTYDLRGGHSHINPHRSSGHYDPTFKIKTRPIIYTDTPPTRGTTTPRPTTTTVRTTTTSRATTTTARSRTRARLNARNPGFSVAFTQASSMASIERSETTTSSSTTKGRNSEREVEGADSIVRRDDSSSITTSMALTTTTTTTTTKPTTTSTTTTAAKPTTTSTTTTTAKPTTSSTTTTTAKPTTTSTTTATAKPTTSSTTTTTEKPSTTSTTKPTTKPETTTEKPAASKSSTTTEKPTTTTTARITTTVSSFSTTPIEETTPHREILNIGSNEIDMNKVTESPRRRPEPFTVERSESFAVESSESVKVIETNMIIDGKNQTVRFYYITQPVKLPLEVFQQMTGQKKGMNGMSVIKIRDRRSLQDSNIYRLQNYQE